MVAGVVFVDTETTTCTVDGCDGRLLARGLCSMHYQRQRVVQRAGGDQPCSACGGDRGKGYRKNPLCAECHRKRVGIWRTRNPETARVSSARSARKAHALRRERVIQRYGGRCACCGEGALAFLAMDHVDGGGNEHRRSANFGGSTGYYRWLETNDYPAGFQVLCHNCNFAKSHGGCPHGNC